MLKFLAKSEWKGDFWSKRVLWGPSLLPASLRCILLLLLLLCTTTIQTQQTLAPADKMPGKKGKVRRGRGLGFLVFHLWQLLPFVHDLGRNLRNHELIVNLSLRSRGSLRCDRVSRGLIILRSPAWRHAEVQEHTQDLHGGDEFSCLQHFMCPCPPCPFSLLSELLQGPSSLQENQSSLDASGPKPCVLPSKKKELGCRVVT